MLRIHFKNARTNKILLSLARILNGFFFFFYQNTTGTDRWYDENAFGQRESRQNAMSTDGNNNCKMHQINGERTLLIVWYADALYGEKLKRLQSSAVVKIFTHIRIIRFEKKRSRPRGGVTTIFYYSGRND